MDGDKILISNNSNSVTETPQVKKKLEDHINIRCHRLMVWLKLKTWFFFVVLLDQLDLANLNGGDIGRCLTGTISCHFNNRDESENESGEGFEVQVTPN